MERPPIWSVRSAQTAPLSLLLHDHCPSQNLVAMCNVANTQIDEVATTQLAVDRQVEQCEVTDVAFVLEAKSDCPIAQMSFGLRGGLGDQFAFVPGFPVLSGFHDRLLRC